MPAGPQPDLRRDADRRPGRDRPLSAEPSAIDAATDFAATGPPPLDAAAFDRVRGLIWGADHLSPGGPEAVAEIVAGLDLAGREVLDHGCGIGAAALTLARDYGARVVGLDIDADAVSRGNAMLAREGVADAARLRHVAPGPLPLADSSVDVVFSKDCWLLIDDKPPAFAELYRVLRPGGALAASDWFNAGAPYSDELERYLAVRGIDYHLIAVETECALLRGAGFADVRFRETTAAVRAQTASDRDRIAGPLRAAIEAEVGAEGHAWFLAIFTGLVRLFEAGELRLGTLRARKPA